LQLPPSGTSQKFNITRLVGNLPLLEDEKGSSFVEFFVVFTTKKPGKHIEERQK
jgi:hypothetical protein